MTLEESIEKLQLIVYRGEDRYDDNDINAIRLGIEALKRIKELRIANNWPQNLTLPSETLDED